MADNSKLKKSLGILQKQAFSVSFNLAGSPYKALETIGTGAYGVVCSAVNGSSGSKVAIKKIANALHNPTVAKRSLREVRILRQFDHPNIIGILDMLYRTGAIGTDIYIVFDLMETDLHHIIHSKQPLSAKHVQYFLYQIVRGMRYVHSGGIIHRDLKPSNIMVNANCLLKIGDFGMARVEPKPGQEQLAQAQAQFMTQYVATRWYRAPELLFSMLEYFSAVDMWSTGCIFGEMLLRRQLFAAKDNLSQLKMIIYYLGSPPPDMMEKIQSEIVQRIIKGVGHKCPLPWDTMFPKLPEEGLNLVGRMLNLSPWERITAAEALEHPYFAEFRDPDSETTCSHVLDLASLEVEHLNKQEIVETLMAEIRSFQPDISAEDFVDDVAMNAMRRESSEPTALGGCSRQSVDAGSKASEIPLAEEVHMLSAQIQDDLAFCHEEHMQTDVPKVQEPDPNPKPELEPSDDPKKKLRAALQQAIEARKLKESSSLPAPPPKPTAQSRHLEKLKRRQRRQRSTVTQPADLQDNPEFRTVSDQNLLERWSKLSTRAKQDPTVERSTNSNLDPHNNAMAPVYMPTTMTPPPGFQGVEIDANNPNLVHAGEHLLYRTDPVADHRAPLGRDPQNRSLPDTAPQTCPQIAPNPGMLGTMNHLGVPTSTTGSRPITTSPTSVCAMEDTLRDPGTGTTGSPFSAGGGCGMAQLGEIISQSLPSPLSAMSHDSARLMDDWRTLTQQLQPGDMQAVEREMWG